MTNYHTIIEIIGEFIGMGFGSLMNPFLWVVAIWLSIKDKQLQPIVLWSALVNAACWVVIMQTSILYMGGPDVSIIFVFLATACAGGMVGLGCYFFGRLFKKSLPSNQETTFAPMVVFIFVGFFGVILLTSQIQKFYKKQENNPENLHNLSQQQQSNNLPLNNIPEAADFQKNDSILVIKGFYIDMPQEEAINNFHKVTKNKFDDYKLYVNNENNAAIYSTPKFFNDFINNDSTAYMIPNGVTSRMEFYENKLKRIILENIDVNNIFNISNIDFMDFLQGFSNAYKIKLKNECEKCDYNLGLRFSYKNFDQGIYVNLAERINFKDGKERTFIFSATPKKSDMKF